MSSETTTGNSEGSPFWNDFWNTIYHFTHPLSSTFFDSLFDDQESDSTGSSPTPTPESKGPSDKGATSNPGSRHFSDQASFEKFWEELRGGKKNADGPPVTPMEHIQEAWEDFKNTASRFISSVEWNQVWIQAILALHLIIFLSVIYFRNRPNPLTAILFATTISEPLNGVGSRHWRKFSDDNYFDSYGVFTSVIWSAPLVGNAILATLLLLRATASLLVKVKKAQLKKDKKKKQK